MQTEINGVIVEFDERAILKQELKVGDSVQLLKGGTEYSDPKLYQGVVTAILPYEEGNAVIEVTYIRDAYNSIEIEREVFQSGHATRDKIIKAEGKPLPYTKEKAVDILDQDIKEKKHALDEAIAKKEYFLKYYGMYLEEISESKKEDE